MSLVIQVSKAVPAGALHVLASVAPDVDFAIDHLIDGRI